MTNLTERLDKHLQSIREANDTYSTENLELVKFLKDLQHKGLNSDTQDDPWDHVQTAIESLKKYPNYDNLLGEGKPIWLKIVKTAFYNEKPDMNLIKQAVKESDADYYLDKALIPVIDTDWYKKRHLDNPLIDKDLKDTTRYKNKLGKNYTIKDVITTKDGSDDDEDYLDECMYYTIVLYRVLKAINTATAKTYIKAIINHPILSNALTKIGWVS